MFGRIAARFYWGSLARFCLMYAYGLRIVSNGARGSGFDTAKRWVSFDEGVLKQELIKRPGTTLTTRSLGHATLMPQAKALRRTFTHSRSDIHITDNSHPTIIAMAAANEVNVKLARALPGQLLRLFTKFPPPQIAGAATTTRTIPSSEETSTITIAENTSSSDPNAGASTTIVTTSPSEAEIAHSETEAKAYRNPFLPFKNPRTGNWHGPAYSLRRQAELFKLAKEHNVLSLMPLSPKHPEVKEQKRIENGLRVQGTGMGKKVKGKAWERTMSSRLEKRRLAMEGMPEMIKQWKERGHGRGWKKWPSRSGSM